MQRHGAYHGWLLAALLTALCVVVGYLFLALPNLELFTTAVFISGFLVGARRGALVGATAAMLFSLFNPYGAPAPTLLAAQVMSMALTGAGGGAIQRSGWLTLRPWLRMLLFAATGLLLTLVYDILTTLSFAVLMAGGDMNKLWATFIAGMGFYGVHLAGNTLIFAVLAPALLQRLSRLTGDA